MSTAECPVCGDPYLDRHVYDLDQGQEYEVQRDEDSCLRISAGDSEMLIFVHNRYI